MPNLIDSDWTADFLVGKPPAIALVQALLPSGMAISAVYYVEIAEGVIGSRNRPALERGFRQFLQGVAVLDFNRAVADRAAAIRLDLRRQKRQVNERALDILIAATAIEHGLTLVTRNTRDYVDIPGLQLYQTTRSWLAGPTQGDLTRAASLPHASSSHPLSPRPAARIVAAHGRNDHERPIERHAGYWPRRNPPPDRRELECLAGRPRRHPRRPPE